MPASDHPIRIQGRAIRLARHLVEPRIDGLLRLSCVQDEVHIDTEQLSFRVAFSDPGAPLSLTIHTTGAAYTGADTLDVPPTAGPGEIAARIASAIQYLQALALTPSPS
ncbi:hypothetical protein [Streptomyces sp. NPDC090022]|uniref:hypothetical protein n=1 Tax=Streptomyces sp. NPDC090022 TaxID=3365920 RepID=UPI003818B973